MEKKMKNESKTDNLRALIELRRRRKKHKVRLDEVSDDDKKGNEGAQTSFVNETLLPHGNVSDLQNITGTKKIISETESTSKKNDGKDKDVKIETAVEHTSTQNESQHFGSKVHSDNNKESEEIKNKTFTETSTEMLNAASYFRSSEAEKNQKDYPTVNESIGRDKDTEFVATASYNQNKIKRCESTFRFSNKKKGIEKEKTSEGTHTEMLNTKQNTRIWKSKDNQKEKLEESAGNNEDTEMNTRADQTSNLKCESQPHVSKLRAKKNKNRSKPFDENSAFVETKTEIPMFSESIYSVESILFSNKKKKGGENDVSKDFAETPTEMPCTTNKKPSKKNKSKHKKYKKKQKVKKRDGNDEDTERNTTEDQASFMKNESQPSESKFRSKKKKKRRKYLDENSAVLETQTETPTFNKSTYYVESTLFPNNKNKHDETYDGEVFTETQSEMLFSTINKPSKKTKNKHKEKQKIKESDEHDQERHMTADQTFNMKSESQPSMSKIRVKKHKKYKKKFEEETQKEIPNKTNISCSKETETKHKEKPIIEESHKYCEDIEIDVTTCQTSDVDKDREIHKIKKRKSSKTIKRKHKKKTAVEEMDDDGKNTEIDTTLQKESESETFRNEFHSKNDRKPPPKIDEENAFASQHNAEDEHYMSDQLEENTYQMRNIVTENGKFSFQLNEGEWNLIKPNTKDYIGIRKRTVRRLQNNWTDIFARNVTMTHPGCVIAFKSHHCKSPKSRRLSGAYVTATAFCKGLKCSGKFVFTIENSNTSEGNIDVHYSVTGHIEHDPEEVNRRNLSGLERKQIGRKLQSTASTMTYYNQLLQGDHEKMSQGNYTSVPNPMVLRKVVSEIIQKEYLHQNIIAELQMLKDNYEKENDPYIRDIGIDPFTLIMFSESQLRTIKTLSAQKRLNVYIDATGSVISKITGQKQPYLYSVVVKPEPSLPGVSVADMITTQHSIPRIELFLNTVKRSASLSGASIKIQKCETDYSFALIQACLKTFNNLNIKSYLVKCSEIINTGEMDGNLTVHHLCSAHIIRDFIKQLKSIKSSVKKQVRGLLLKSFALLQNASSMKEAKNIYTDICQVFLSENVNSNMLRSLENINKLSKSHTIEEDDEDDVLDQREELLAEDVNIQHQTIRAASPFTKIFQDITRRIESEQSLTSGNDTNEFHFPEAVHCLLEKFMHILPLWSGIILSKQVYNEQSVVRDTNSPVEDWFKVVKLDIGLKSRLRPSKFVINLKTLINGRLLELQFPNARKKQTPRKRKTDVENIEITEEIWSKRSAKKKPKYMPKKKIRQQTMTDKQLPSVMTWGGELKGVSLDNTCTIDNGLTILHLFYIQNPSFADYLHESKGNIWGTLLTVFELMTACEFIEAKLVWVNYTRQNVPLPAVTNLYGDEADKFFYYLDREWVSLTESICIPSCPEPFKETRETRCVNTNTSEAFSSLQDLVDKWMADTETCNYSCEDDGIRVCTGVRNCKRKIKKFSPILIIRLYEHCLHNRISTSEVMASEAVKIEDRSYKLAGITMHRDLHYCAVILYMHTFYWYDGLRGRLQDIPNDLENWFPCHAVYCQQR